MTQACMEKLGLKVEGPSDFKLRHTGSPPRRWTVKEEVLTMDGERGRAWVGRKGGELSMAMRGS